MFSDETWDFMRKAGILVGLSGAVVAFAWFCFATANRIAILENQMQLVGISGPVIPKPGGEPTVRTTSIAQVCAELARNLAALPPPSPPNHPTALSMDRLGRMSLT